jgi:hypothetical protein
MNTQQATVTGIEITDAGIYAAATCGKVSALVFITSLGFRVICQNAAHKVWRGSGRSFSSFEEALAAYKKPEMKAIITAVEARKLTQTL